MADRSFYKGNGIQQGDVIEGDTSAIKEFVVQKGNQPLDIKINLEDIQTPYTLPMTSFTASTKAYMQIKKEVAVNNGLTLVSIPILHILKIKIILM